MPAEGGVCRASTDVENEMRHKVLREVTANVEDEISRLAISERVSWSNDGVAEIQVEL